MQPFRRFSTIRGIGFFTVVSLAVLPFTTNTNIAKVAVAVVSETVMTETNDSIVLPDWLPGLDLNDVQMYQVVEIDALLEQQLELILTGSQYSQWQSSQIMLSEESWSFADLGIELSPYQQVAVDASFKSAMQNLLSILSLEQKQQLMQQLSEENIIPGPDSET